MSKIRSKKFWIIFWTIATLFLVGWYFFLQNKNDLFQSLVGIFPIGEKNKAVAFLADYLTKNDDQEKTFLILFENNMEIRPGGGFIGSFGIVKIKNGKVGSLDILDSGNFDAQVPKNIVPPYPMEETAYTKFWQLRDSNFSPDFSVNAQKAEEFYHLGQGQEKLDGIIGITANVLTSMLKVIGPVELEGYPGTYADENAILALEYQVEKGFDEQGIARVDRKSVMESLADVILKRVAQSGLGEKIKLIGILADDLDTKNITLYFKDPRMQAQIEKSGWTGTVDQTWDKDYLMTVDANLGAWKTDFSVRRSLDYTIDLSGEKPKAVLKIRYENTATQKDFMTKNYLTYLRVYVPEGSWLTGSENFDDARFGTELGKKYFGAIIRVPLNSEKTVTLEYDLPEKIAADYALKIQKQAGLNNIPVAVHVKGADGQTKDYAYTMNSDITLDK
jgi:hypothetical protein